MSGIVIAGSILVDKIYDIKAYPNSGQLTQIKSLSRAVGGCVPNVAIDLARLSKDIKISAIGKIGLDDDGAYVSNVLKGEGVLVDGIVKSKDATTSFTNVMNVIDGERTFFTYSGASADFGYDDINFDSLNCKMFHLGYFLLLDKVDNGDGLKILIELSNRGIKTSIDLVSENSDRYKNVIPCLKYTDNVIINEIEAGNIAGVEPTIKNLKEIATIIKNYGVRDRVIIHMPEVSCCLDDNEFVLLPSLELPNGYIKGKTGAGDAFCAGALLSIYQGLNNKEILENASYSATMALSSKDAVSGMVDMSLAIKNCKNFKRKII